MTDDPWRSAFAHHEQAPLVWISLINEGYLPFAKHFQRNLDSLHLNHPAFRLIVACSDDAALEGARALGMNAVRLPCTGSYAKELTTYSTPAYNAITFAKLDALRGALFAARRAGVGLLGFIDFDITLMSNPTNLILQLAQEKPEADVFAQCEEGGQSACRETSAVQCPNMCSGVLVLRTGNCAIDSCLTYSAEDVASWPGDQGFLSKGLKKLSIRRAALPRATFPNGSFAGVNKYDTRQELTGAALVHFNWLLAGDKVRIMKAWNMWFGD